MIELALWVFVPGLLVVLVAYAVGGIARRIDDEVGKR